MGRVIRARSAVTDAPFVRYGEKQLFTKMIKLGKKKKEIRSKLHVLHSTVPNELCGRSQSPHFVDEGTTRKIPLIILHYRLDYNLKLSNFQLLYSFFLKLFFCS